MAYNMICQYLFGIYTINLSIQTHFALKHWLNIGLKNALWAYRKFLRVYTHKLYQNAGIKPKNLSICPNKTFS